MKDKEIAKLLLRAVQWTTRETKDKDLNDEYLATIDTPLSPITCFFAINNMEAVVLSLYLHAQYRNITLEADSLVQHFGENIVALADIQDAIDSLLEKKFLFGSNNNKKDKLNGEQPTYRVNYKIMEAVINGDVTFLEAKPILSFLEWMEEFNELQPMRKTGYMNTQRFIMEVNALLAQHQTIDEIRWIEKLELGNHEKVLFIALVAEHLYESEQIDLDDVCRDLFDSPLIRANLKKGLRDGSHPFLQKSLIQYHSDDFIMGNYVKLSEDVQANLIGEDIKLEQRLFKPRMGTLIAPQTIAQEALFYNNKEEKQIELLAKTLEENRLQIVFNNLKQASMKPGLNILLMGGPGTGKTATVRNLARQTNRSILMVSIDKIQSKWVGDSEKNLKRVFDEYRTLCKSSEQTPILLFNEADAILGRRIEVTRSVDQMNNALQNILLQELEDFEGIFMATTNFATHLDSAFDRRFLFKVELEMPDEDVRLKILENNFKDVANETLQEINSLYRLTGAQINNIKKKLLIRTALEFEASANEILFTLCEEEFAIKRSQHKKAIGFTH